MLTREDDLNQVPLVDIFGRSQSLQHIVGAQVMPEEQDLVVEAKEAALRELGREGDGKVISKYPGSTPRSRTLIQGWGQHGRSSSGPCCWIHNGCHGEHRSEQ